MVLDQSTTTALHRAGAAMTNSNTARQPHGLTHLLRFDTELFSGGIHCLGVSVTLPVTPLQHSLPRALNLSYHISRTASNLSHNSHLLQSLLAMEGVLHCLREEKMVAFEYTTTTASFSNPSPRDPLIPTSLSDRNSTGATKFT